jgi:hypothetical protein
LAELNLEEERVVSVDGALKPGEISHVKNIYIGQLEANYGGETHASSI